MAESLSLLFLYLLMLIGISCWVSSFFQLCVFFSIVVFSLILTYFFAHFWHCHSLKQWVLRYFFPIQHFHPLPSSGIESVCSANYTGLPCCRFSYSIRQTNNPLFFSHLWAGELFSNSLPSLASNLKFYQQNVSDWMTIFAVINRYYLPNVPVNLKHFFYD